MREVLLVAVHLNFKKKKKKKNKDNTLSKRPIRGKKLKTPGIKV